MLSSQKLIVTARSLGCQRWKKVPRNKKTLLQQPTLRDEMPSRIVGEVRSECFTTATLHSSLHNYQTTLSRSVVKGRAGAAVRLDGLGELVRREFHATQKQEILPVIAVGALLVIGRYSWKALQRMDEEWEDYQWQLVQYERLRQKQNAETKTSTLGIDLGSFFLKLASVYPGQPNPTIVLTGQGDRFQFAGVRVEADDSSQFSSSYQHRQALEQFFYKPSGSTANESIVLPYTQIQQRSVDHQAEVRKLVQQLLVPAVEEAAKTTADNSSETTEDVRTVIALPPSNYTDDEQLRETMTTELKDNFSQSSNSGGTKISFLPASVAAIWGAQSLKLLPAVTVDEASENVTKDDDPIVLVIDVGGLVTTLSLVQHDRVLSSATLDGIGGESYVQKLVDLIVEKATNVTSSPFIRDDPMSLQLVNQQARSSVLELIHKTQTKVHIPFLFMGQVKPTGDSSNMHFDMTLSRTVVEQTIQEHWRENVISTFGGQDKNILSSSLPLPNDLTSLMISAITGVLEEGNSSGGRSSSEYITPGTLDYILFVGGGSRHALFEESCREAVDTLLGYNQESTAKKWVVPDASIRAEVTAVGAASLLPNFTYSYDVGGLELETEGKGK